MMMIVKRKACSALKDDKKNIAVNGFVQKM